MALLIAENTFNCNGSLTALIVGVRGAPLKWLKYRTAARVRHITCLGISYAKNGHIRHVNMALQNWFVHPANVSFNAAVPSYVSLLQPQELRQDLVLSRLLLILPAHRLWDLPGRFLIPPELKPEHDGICDAKTRDDVSCGASWFGFHIFTLSTARVGSKQHTLGVQPQSANHQ